MSLAGATIFLVVVSACAILAQIGIYCRSKVFHERGRKAKAFRMALIEQLDQCRHVVSHPPGEDPPGFDGLLNFVPRFLDVNGLLEEVTLPMDRASRGMFCLYRKVPAW